MMCVMNFVRFTYVRTLLQRLSRVTSFFFLAFTELFENFSRRIYYRLQYRRALLKD